MLENFGARLRQRREQQGIDLIAIAAQTKIKLSLLQALERDDVSGWPSGIFRRAYIRAYAQSIGLDPDVVVREFLQAHPEPDEIVTTEAIASALDSSKNGGPPTRLRYIVGSAIGSLARLRRGQGNDDLAAPVHASADRASAGGPEDAVPEKTDAPIPGPVLAEVQPVASDPAPVSPEPVGFDLLEIANLCSGFARVESARDVQPLLGEAARILDASGVIVWIWDGTAERLRPALAHGYSDRVLAHLPPVARDADNATAAAFRSGQTCAINGSERVNGALVVPLLAPSGCGGVLAIELPHSAAREPAVRGVAMIVAAQLAQLTGRSQPAETREQDEIPLPAAVNFAAMPRRSRR